VTRRLKPYLLLHALLLLYACASVCAKLAAAHPPLSARFLLLYGISLLLLAVYALAWQQALKRLPLSIAYANKGVVLLWGMLLGGALWGETVTLAKAAALGVVLTGIWLVSDQRA
jgi:multidrug transporter EmrE-like cation transporter